MLKHWGTAECFNYISIIIIIIIIIIINNIIIIIIVVVVVVTLHWRQWLKRFWGYLIS